MYGRGNYGSPFGQGPRRPMPPYQQQPTGLHFPQGRPFPPPQGGFAHSIPPLPSAYPRPQPLLPLAVPGGASVQPPYMAAQHNHPPITVNHHHHHLPPPPPSSGPQIPPPPPPLYGQTIYGVPSYQPPHSSQLSIQHMPPPPGPPLPPSSPPMPPPPPSTSSPSLAKLSPSSDPINASVSSPIHSGSSPSSGKSPLAAGIAIHSHNKDDAPIPDDDFSRGQNIVDDLPPPPPKPEDEKVVRNIEVLCNFIAKNGPGFEEMARQKEHGNPDFKFLFEGEPGNEASCAREYYLWMKKKCGVASGSNEGQGDMTLPIRHVDVDPLTQPNALAIIATTHSPADSDVDMEDDITQSDKDPVLNSAEVQNPESILTEDVLENENQDNTLQYSSVDVSLGQQAESQAVVEAKYEKSSDKAASIDSPFRLIQNYASDDSSQDGQSSNEKVKAVRVSPPHKPVVLLCPEDVLKEDVDAFQAVETGLQESLTKASSLDKFEVDDRTARAEPSSPNYSSQQKYASERENRSVTEKEDKDKFSRALKIDEFGRLIQKGASDSESDDAYHSRRRGKRERGRSPSRSPSDRRRRSPHRRKDRSRSPSWSPKRRRSRSRSPYRHGGDFGGEKLRRDKVQTRQSQCFDFLKGRCYRGASCRYAHHESGQPGSSRRYRSKEEHKEDISSSRNSDICDGNVTSRLHNEVKGEKMDHHLDKRDGIDSTSKGYEAKNKGSIYDDLQGVDELENVQNSQHSREGHAQVQGVSQDLVSRLPNGEERPTSGTPSINESTIHESIAGDSAQALHRPDGDSQKVDNSTKSESLSNSTLDFSHQFSHLPPPPPPPPPIQSTSTSQALSHQVDNKIVVPQSGPVESGPSYQAQLPNQQSNYSVPPNPSWSIPPPPPPQPHPPYVGDLSMPGPLSFQPGNPPLRKDFPIHTSLPSHSQVGGYQHQTYFMHAQFPSQGSLPFGSFPPGNMPPLMPFPGDTNVKNMQSFQGSNPLPEPSNPTFQNQTFVQQIPLPYTPQLNATDSMSSFRDHPTRFLDIGGPRISAHYNPYASTFDKPLTSRFTATAFVPDRETASGSKYDSSSAIGNILVEGQSLPKSGGDQYDPLFDSMDPNSESFKKRTRKQGGHAADNSDILKLNSRCKVLDVEENNKQKEVGAVASSNSLENDEFGETADAEVGAVDNESPSDPDDDVIVAEGEIEIDQVRSEGKNNKNKDSRSMKLFKIAVANFVKDVLKPQWRQGNMSKEVFKTIVKKTVEKVSGAMKNRRVPKSQAKIDLYIDAQRRKLTQLVEGYVSKYKI